MIFPKRNAILLLLVLAVSIQAESASEESPAPGYRIHRSIPPQGAKTHVVVPGERFRAGGFKRWFYGSDYRDLWTTPIEVMVLDLGRVGGGLTPLRTGGFGQSISLHFTGQDGRRYTVRSLDKDATRRIWDELKNTVVADVLQDLISAMLPTGALVIDPLMEATGILHSKHTLVVIPDDLRLGEYRKEFAGLIGMLQEHPSEGPDDTPGFAGSRKISGTDKLWEHLEKNALQPRRCPCLSKGETDGFSHQRQGSPLRPVALGAVFRWRLLYLATNTRGSRPSLYRLRRVCHDRGA